MPSFRQKRSVLARLWRLLGQARKNRSLEPALRQGLGSIDRQLDGLFHRLVKLEEAALAKGSSEGAQAGVSQAGTSQAGISQGFSDSVASSPVVQDEAGDSPDDQSEASAESADPLSVVMELGDRLTGIDEWLVQAARRERRSMTALDALADGQDKILELLGAGTEAKLGALMDFGEAMIVFLWPLVARDGSTDARIVMGKFIQLLEAHDLKMLGFPGEPFNPSFHEAVHVESFPGFTDGAVLKTVKPGFVSKTGVQRYASVVVNRIAAGEAREIQFEAPPGEAEPRRIRMDPTPF